ncbi:group 1 truncated hemoglobin [Hymenobacter sp. H14-R3]|uniref:group I truncated hemoglobin n=1 Tax=Hymenobacter sp. H14-R3 TaxID=3046308 RepID=UPI0024B92A9E|nr:group 1 truncated hemoglobin [Hymenobacter sp. H14-R3]MDJ0365378.1 group 1 truncated hemoglobin [Hymenobacter sp. H14-R3]
MFKPQLPVASAFVLGLALLTTACGSKDSAAPTSLYDRMGGKTGIESVTDQLVANVGAEAGQASSVMVRSHKPMLDAIGSQNGQPATDPTRLQRLRNNVVDQFTDITGGPIKYKGQSMLVAHTNMKVTNAEYNAWRALLDNSLATNKIGATEKKEFAILVDAMRNDVVNH